MRPALSLELTDSEAARFASHVRRVGECDEWTASLAPSGYGVFCLRGSNRRAHRVSYAATVGPVPEGMSVCHRCDNRACVRPDHLFLGTDRDNTHDAIAKGRFVKVTPKQPLTHCAKGHEFTPENTILGTGKRGRSCRTCRRDHWRERARRIRAQRAQA